MKTLIYTGLVFLGVASATQADQVVNENLIVDSQLLCVGTACVDGETQLTNRQGIKIHGLNIGLLFDDNSGSGSGNPDTDWQISINDTVQNGMNKFSIEDVTGGSVPLTIQAGAPTNALYIRTNGNFGLGTGLPLRDLHIVDETTPTIRLEQVGISPYTWDIQANGGAFSLKDTDPADDIVIPFSIETRGIDDALVVKRTGSIGFGTSSPEGKFHTEGDGVQLMYFESTDGGPVQVRFRTDSENRRFLAVNNANEVKSQIIFLDDRINFTGQTDSGANLWLSIGPDGIISQGPTCGTPCDLTFDPEVFSVPPIDERAEYMWDNMHLPAIGPTNPDMPINLTEKTGGIIHELEVAHIYIEQLHARDAQQQAQIDVLTARLEALEAE